MKALYKLNCDCGRNGSLYGLFIASPDHVKILIDEKIEVYFGEVLGKHSDISGSLSESDIIFITSNPEILKIVEDNKMECGYNPFDQQGGNPDYDGTVLEFIVQGLYKK